MPAVGLADPPRCPRERILVTVELDHGFSDFLKLIRHGEVTAEQRDDGADVVIDHGKPFLSPPHSEGFLAFTLPAFDLAPIGGQPDVAEGVAVPKRIEVEEVLYIEIKTRASIGQV